MTTQGIVIPNKDNLAWIDVKDPQSVKDYELDLAGFSNGGYLQGDTIDSIISITLESLSGLILGDGTNGAPAVSTDGTRIILWFIAGGEIGNWDVTVRFKTSRGITDDVTRVLQVKNT